MTRRWIVVTFSWAMACGPEPSAEPAKSDAPAPAAEAPAESKPAGDPLLARAREGISMGRLAADAEAELTGSTAPQHARARRILLAMAEPPVAADAEPEPSADASLKPPPIVPQSDAVPSVDAGSSTKPRASPPKSGADRPKPPAPRAAAEVRRLSMKSTKKGATLTIAAPSSLVVGVANQPSSGIVRLVIEKAQAGGSVLTTRPKLVGAAVTAVRQGKDTVQITLRLDPGWSLGSVKPFSGGAKVHLRAPR